MEATTWELDPAHSELQFKVKHMMITNVTGSFPVISGTIETNAEDLSDATVHFTADIADITTFNKDRDKHLKSKDFFDVEKYPELVFDTENFNADKNKVSGTLTMKGVAKPITLDVIFEGREKDPWGNEKIGFSLSGNLNRKEWGLNYNAALESGGVLVSDEVKVTAEVQFVKKTS